MEKSRKKRFKEINDRLKALKSDDVRRFLFKYGFFLENHYLPSDFYHSKVLGDKNVFKKLKKHTNDLSGNDKPTFLFFPKNKYVIKALGVPSLRNHIGLSNFIADNWTKIRNHLILNKDDLIIPYTYPLFYEDKKRSDVGLNNFKVFSEIDFAKASDKYSHCLFLDIKNFYSSIYTHSIAWALDPKTAHGGKCSCRGNERCSSHKRNYWPNQIDEFARKQNRNRTKGILIGPSTSDLLSEILLRAVDRNISKICNEQRKKILGLRFKDDYVIFTNSKEEADSIRKDIQYILNEFHLEVSEHKTEVISIEDFKDKKVWKVTTEKLVEAINIVFKENEKDGKVIIKEKHLRLWIKEMNSLYDAHQDEYIIKTIIGRLIKKNINAIKIKKDLTTTQPYQVGLPETYSSLFATIAQLCKKAPSTWPLFLLFVCLCFEGVKKGPVKTLIKRTLFNYAEMFTKDDETFPLIWTLYAIWRCKLKLSASLYSQIKSKFSDNWLIMSTLDIGSSTQKVGGASYSLTERDLDELLSIFEVMSIFGYSSK